MRILCLSKNILGNKQDFGSIFGWWCAWLIGQEKSSFIICPHLYLYLYKNCHHMAQFYLFYNILKLYFLFALSHLFSHYFPFSPLKNSCICKGSTPSLVCGVVNLFFLSHLLAYYSIWDKGSTYLVLAFSTWHNFINIFVFCLYESLIR